MQEKFKPGNRTNEKIKVVFMIPSLVPGGAERVFAYVSQHLDPDKFSAQLLVMGKVDQTTYEVDKIPVIYLGKDRVLHAIPKLISYLIKEKPHITLSSIGHLNMISGLLARLFPSIRFIIRPTNIESKNSGAWLPRKCFAQVDAVICQSQDMAKNFRKLYGITMEKITVIQNPITNADEITVADAIHQTKRFVTVGRLNKIKGHDRIIRLLSKLNTDFHYTIIGDGPERENLLEQIELAGLKQKVTHIRHTGQVNDYLMNNDLFLQGSYSEGFPNAALESCTMGTPVLAFDVPGGTKEIIEHGVNGFLCETEDQFLAFLQQKETWSRQNIHDSVIKKFGSKKIMEKYNDLFSVLSS